MMYVLLQEREVHVVLKYSFVSGVNKTQCIKQCKLDKENKYCVSCLRTIEEIKDNGKRIHI